MCAFFIVAQAVAAEPDFVAAADGVQGSGRICPDPGLRCKPRSRGDAAIKTCRHYSKEHGSSDGIDVEAGGRQAAPLFLDAVMYFQARPGANDVKGEGDRKLPGYDRGQGPWEPGVIEICRHPPRYY